MNTKCVLYREVLLYCINRYILVEFHEECVVLLKPGDQLRPALGLQVWHLVVCLGRVFELPDRGCGLAGLTQVHVVVDVVHHTLGEGEERGEGGCVYIPVTKGVFIACIECTSYGGGGGGGCVYIPVTKGVFIACIECTSYGGGEREGV